MFRSTGRVPRGAAVAIVVICAYAAGTVSGGGPEADPSGARRSALLDETALRVGERASGPVGSGVVDGAAIEGLLHRMGDRWARYYSPSEYDEFKGRLEGRYSGVGLWLGTHEEESPQGSGGKPAAGRVLVAGVRPGSAAERAGVRGGDSIVAVDGRRAEGWDVSRVSGALRGRPGTRVELTVLRNGREYRFAPVRTAVRADDVIVSRPGADTRMIRVEEFTRGVGEEIRAAVAGGRGAEGILLDLRGNPGGLLEEAVEAASAFLPGGLVVTYERPGQPAERLTVTRPGDPSSPVVVLVDGGTASAAEVVAGSLRDRDRAVIVGSRTYGKGAVQEPVELPDGSAVELTVGRYRTPGGRNLDGAGIEPDVPVPADRPPRAAEQRGQSVLRGLLATLPDRNRG
ncbi:S41 family peptidase [Actinomadura vinacea]|uniref:S41 family peptidase n=1 Tax=Actinomadura vinacea TaxID=115336 RepID=A0ABN3J749_9ACTN